MKFESKYDWQKISPDIPGSEFMFGYYDRCAWDVTGTHHLVLQIPELPNRLPQKGENAVIGLLDGKGGYTPLVETGTWCHQQGCMQLFLKHRPDCFVYNDYDKESGSVIARIYQLGKGIVGRYERPVYAMSPDGKYAASLNFSRIPRRGYSYAYAELSTDRFPADLDADGIWIMDLESGESRLAVSYRTMIEQHPYPYALEGKYIWLNHVIFNSDSSKILWLFRSISDEIGLSKMWQTFMYTSDIHGSNVRCTLPEVYWTKMISHQIWGADPNEIMVDANWDGTGHRVMVFDDRRSPFQARKVADSHGMMTHLVYSPDGSMILADSYPDKERKQTMLLIDARNGKSVMLGKFRQNTPPDTILDKRCDLHPRWNPAGNVVTIDSIDSGKKAVYLLDLEQAIKDLKDAAS